VVVDVVSFCTFGGGAVVVVVVSVCCTCGWGVPIVQFILDLSKKHPARNIIVVIPELVEDKWYEYFLHNQRAHLLEWVLLARGNERIFAVSAPWYIEQQT
jgi:hypothetical protein